MVSKASKTSRHSLTLEVPFTITSYANQESGNIIVPVTLSKTIRGNM